MNEEEKKIKLIEKYIRSWDINSIDEKTMLIMNDILLIINGNEDLVVRLKENLK